MSSVYKILFTISLSSNYFDNGICPDLAIEPTEACLKEMKRYRLFFRRSAKGGAIFYEGRPDTTAPPATRGVLPLLPVTVTTLFSFRLLVLNYNFVQYTDIPNSAMFKGRPVFRFTNGNILNAENIQLLRNTDPLPAPLTIEAPNFPFPVELDNNPSVLEVKNEVGQLVFQMDVRGKTTEEQARTNADGTVMKIYEYISVDLKKYEQPDGIYTFTVKRGGVVVPALTKTIYISREYIKDAFGIIDVQYRWGQLADNTHHQDFQVNFNSRSVHWHYIIHLRDANGPAPASPVTVNNITVSHDTLTFTNTLRDAAQKLARFESDTVIKLTQKGYMGVKLQKTGAGARTLMDQLPNPSPLGVDITQDISIMHVTV